MDTLFFVLSKVLGVLIRVESWLLIGLVLSALGLICGWLRLARRASLATLAGFVIVGVVPLHHPVLHWIETRHAPVERDSLNALDGIVVLGGSELPALSRYWGQVQLNGAAERIIEGAALAQAYPQARLVHTGGSGQLSDLGGDFLSEARVARRVYVSLGLDPARLTLEERSRNTFENARNARALVTPEPEERWVLVTSAAHMPRALRTFHAAGWDTIRPWPVDYRTANFRAALGWSPLFNIAMLNATLRESIGLVVYAWRNRHTAGS